MASKTDLVIVESPSKAKTIGKYLGPGYEVKASMGHVRDLPKSKMSVDIEGGFIPNYQPIKGKEDVISDLKKAAKKSGRVYLDMPIAILVQFVWWFIDTSLTALSGDTKIFTFFGSQCIFSSLFCCKVGCFITLCLENRKNI